MEERDGLKYQQLPLSRGAVDQHFEEIQVKYLADFLKNNKSRYRK